MVDEDKYPTESGRRRFVKGVVGSAALSGLTATAAAGLNSATSSTGAGGGTTEFIGIENIAGPAPRGMPIVPVRITDEGELRGLWPEVSQEGSGASATQVAQQDVGGTTYSSSWFQYCGVQQYAGTQPTADADNYFRVVGDYAWASELEKGRPLRVDDFSDYREWGNGIGRSGLGKPADADWRGTEGGRPLPVQVVRSPEVPKMANGEGQYSSIPEGVRSFIQAATQESFIAWLNKCTHFCCVPGFKTSAYSGAEDAVYCQCHQSVYNPFSPVRRQFVALPRPKE